MTVFVITGARGGIGLEYVRQISSNPLNTVVGLVRDVKGDLSSLKEIQAKNPGRVHILAGDVSSGESISRLAADIASLLGPGTKIDVVINNAALLDCLGETALSVTADNILAHINTNVAGPARVVQSLLPDLAPGAIIANITSGMGSMGMLSQGRIAPRIASYSMSKAALNMLTVHLAYLLKGKAIVVSVDPGHVKTPMGGADATLEIADSAEGVLGTLGGLKAEDSGKFLLYNGTELPW